ncbi:MAG: cyanophycinase [Gemmatimonadota bacterium]
MNPPRDHDNPRRGHIVPIGGAEEKLRDAAILKRFVDLCGGADARIAVLPTASELAETGPRYAELLGELGAGDVWSHRIDSREQAEAEGLALRDATGVFLTGGNQLRLSTTIGGTALAATLRSANAAGVHIAGTSAGAAFLCEHMIAFGRSGAIPRADMVTLAPGLGLTNAVIIDQHFRQRDRLGRLLTALAYNPFAIGLGLDENTAAFIDAGDRLEVVGGGGLAVLDPSELAHSSMDSAKKRQPVCLIGLRLHVLTAGAAYDVRAREAYAPGSSHAADHAKAVRHA